FSHKLYEALVAQKPNQNIIFSPFSIQTCAAMARLGALGETADQLDRGLELVSKDTNQIAASFHQVLSAYENSPILHIANKIYVQQSYELKKEFSGLVTRQFLSAAENLDFANNVGAAAAINSWVEQKTNNLIKNLINPGVLNSDTRLVLVNAIHFKGEWVVPFDVHYTRDEAFFLNEADSIDVPMMIVRSKFRWGNLRNLDAVALELPYKDSNLSMIVVLPNSKTGLPELEKKLRTTKLSEISQQLHKTEVIVQLPKFKSELEVELTPAFKSLGMTKMFSDDAEFGNMLNSPERLKVSAVIHKAFIEVNEKGTEAAASS
ncbi:hypothetical protein KR222_004330, partial [Zaprionus bogoriensis]